MKRFIIPSVLPSDEIGPKCIHQTQKDKKSKLTNNTILVYIFGGFFWFVWSFFFKWDRVALWKQLKYHLDFPDCCGITVLQSECMTVRLVRLPCSALNWADLNRCWSHDFTDPYVNYTILIRLCISICMYSLLLLFLFLWYHSCISEVIRQNLHWWITGMLIWSRDF